MSSIRALSSVGQSASFTPKRSGVRVPLRPLEPFDGSVKRFFASLRFEQRGKLDEIGFKHDKK